MGGAASDLHLYAFLPNSGGIPAKGGKRTGSVYIAWTPAGGERQTIVVPDVEMIFDTPMGDHEQEGIKFERWRLKPVKTEGFNVPGRNGGFVLESSRSYRLVVPVSDSE